MARVFYVPLCGNTEVERTPNESQHTKLTVKKKILPPLLLGLELATFGSRVRRFPNKLSRLPVKIVEWKREKQQRRTSTAKPNHPKPNRAKPLHQDTAREKAVNSCGSNTRSSVNVTSGRHFSPFG